MNGNLSSMMEKVVKVLRFSSMSEQEWLDGPVKVPQVIFDVD